MTLPRDTIRAVDKVLIERYSQRLAMYGDDPRTLGWDTRQHQYRRFTIATQLVALNGKTLLDVGCGLADFRHFLTKQGIRPLRYTGIDINDDLLSSCRASLPHDHFVRGNILLDSPPEDTYDVVVAFGLVNFRFPHVNPAEYAADLLRKTYALARDTVLVDALSTARDPSYPEESFVFYHDPATLLQNALELTPYVSLRHDYDSLPQREMMLALRKTPAP